MALRFDEIPVGDERLSRSRTRRPAASRRAILRTGVAAATAAAFGVLDAVNASMARALYFNEYIFIDSGPCGPGGYARNHTEVGWKCGPSLQCTACCWTGSNNGTNMWGWHRNESVPPVEYYHRENECWSGGMDAWRWRFSDNRVYRCSDGYRYTNSSGTVKTICPWQM
jgi:hypothetical protein